MTQELDLAELRKIVEAATPGPWEAKPYIYGVDDDGRIRVTSPSDSGNYNLAESVLPNVATHIATFDPPTVLALLDRLEQTEQAVARVREAVKDAPTEDPTRGFAGPPDDYPDIGDFIGNGEWTVADRVRRALDGDNRG